MIGLTGAKLGRNQARRLLGVLSRNHGDTVKQAKEMIGEAKTRRGYGMGEQEMGCDEEIHRWEQEEFGEEQFEEVVYNPDDKN